MATSLSYSVGVVVLMLASMLVVAQNNGTDPCTPIKDCKLCVVTISIPPNNASLCVFVHGGQGCAKDGFPAETVVVSRSPADCDKNEPVTPTTQPPPTTTTSSPNSTSTTSATPTTTATTPSTPTTTTNGTAPTTTTTPAPSTTTPNSTSTTAAPTPTPAPSTTPGPSSTSTPKPDTPKSGGMSFASFFGGIVFTLGVSAVGYLVWRFYKVRMDRNYHTLTKCYGSR